MKILKPIIKKVLRGLANTYERVMNFEHRESPYTKNCPSGWSIVVITNGSSDNCLKKLIDSALDEFRGTNHEIIVVGPPKIKLLKMYDKIFIKHVKYRELSIPSVGGWITKKKNIGIRNTKYDKVVVCHDYVVFNKGWMAGFNGFDDFDVCTNIIVDIDDNRNTDWITWDYPNIGQAFLPYDKSCSEYQYICGIYFIGKRNFLLKYPQLEDLRWGEAEDIEWSKGIRNKTMFKINTNSSVKFSKKKWVLPDYWFIKCDELKKILS